MSASARSDATLYQDVQIESGRHIHSRSIVIGREELGETFDRRLNIVRVHEITPDRSAAGRRPTVRAAFARSSLAYRNRTGSGWGDMGTFRRHSK